MSILPFTYRRLVHFYETDAMGIVHHARYLYLMEEARVEVLRAAGIFDQTSIEDINYPVLDAQIDYRKPLYFNDEVEILVTARSEMARLFFDYEFRTKRFSTPVAFGKTVHTAMEMSTRKPMRIPAVIQNLLK